PAPHAPRDLAPELVLRVPGHGHARVARALPELLDAALDGGGLLRLRGALGVGGLRYPPDDRDLLTVDRDLRRPLEQVLRKPAGEPSACLLDQFFTCSHVSTITRLQLLREPGGPTKKGRAFAISERPALVPLVPPGRSARPVSISARSPRAVHRFPQCPSLSRASAGTGSRPHNVNPLTLTTTFPSDRLS